MTAVKRLFQRLAWLATIAGGLVAASGPALGQDTIKVGVLHSLSGTMAISETVLKDVTLMAIDDINSKGDIN